MDIALHLGNMWNDKFIDFSQNEMRENELVLFEEMLYKFIIRFNKTRCVYEMTLFVGEMPKWRMPSCGSGSVLPHQFASQICKKYSNDTTCDKLCMNTNYWIVNYMDCANYYFQQYKTEFVEHCTKQVASAWFLEYYNNPHNYVENNMHLTPTEYVFANEYIMGIVEKY